MSVVFLGENKLWVEGDKAFSVDEVMSKYNELIDEVILTTNELDEVNSNLSELTSKKNELEGIISADKEQLADLKVIIDKISEENNKDHIEEVATECEIIEEVEEKVEDSNDIPTLIEEVEEVKEVEVETKVLPKKVLKKLTF